MSRGERARTAVALPSLSAERHRPHRRPARTALAGVALGMIAAGVGAQHALPSARAEGATGFERRPYVGIGAGVSRLEPESPSDSLAVADESSAGAHVYAGYDLTRWLSAELYFADLGEAGIEFLGSGVGDVGYRTYGVNAVAHLLGRGGFGPLAGAGSDLARRRGPSLFLTAGIGGLDNDSDLDYRRDYAAHVTFGAGIEYGFANGLAIRAELQSYDVDAQYASLSVLKRFGGSRAAAAAPRSRAPAPAPTPPVEPKASAPAPAVPAIAAATPTAPAPYDGPTMFRPIVPPYLYFGFDSAELTPGTRAKLDAFADEVRDTDFELALGGHADSIGPEAYNYGLSERRARAVREYLVERGIDPARLGTDAWGETRPISTNATPEGRADNRRAEIALTR